MHTRMRMLHYGRQSVDRADVDAVVDVLRSDFLTQGPVVERFEAAVAERVNAQHAIAVSSGTAALHIAALAAEINPGDFGATAAVTFVASANCIRYSGGEVLFTDIDPDSLGMSPAALQNTLARENATKIVIPVHMGGLAHASEEIRAIAAKRCLIEDAAHSFGGTYECGKPVGCGAYADMTVFSFHPVKPITTAEGGVVVTNNRDLAKRLRMLRNHGIERSEESFKVDDRIESGRIKPWHYEVQILGFNYRMTDLQAALGLSQLNKLEKFVARRRAIARRYDEAFRQLPNVRLPQSEKGARDRSALHLYVAVFDFAAMGITRTLFMERLASYGIGSQVHYIPIYRQPYYKERYGIDPKQFPAAEGYYKGCLSLPLFPALADEDIERVVSAVTAAILES